MRIKTSRDLRKEKVSERKILFFPYPLSKLWSVRKSRVREMCVWLECCGDWREALKNFHEHQLINHHAITTTIV